MMNATTSRVRIDLSPLLRYIGPNRYPKPRTVWM